MSRNKIETHEAIFKSLIDVVKKSGETAENLDKKRFIKLSEEGENCLAKAKIEQKYEVSPRVRTASLSFQAGHFLLISGLENFNNFDLPPVEEENPLYAALLEVAFYELKIALINNPEPLVIINEIIPFYMEVENETYEGHDIDTIKRFFLPTQIYEIESGYPLQANQLIQLVGLRLCQQPDNLALPFSGDTLELFKQVFLEGSAAIPYDNLLQCCYSVSWKHAFLEMYRCVERLYPIPLLDKLHSEMGLDPEHFSLLKLGKTLEDILSWRPLEESSVKKIIEASPKETKSLLKEVKDSMPRTKSYALEKWFYGIRNNIVHFRAATPIIEMSDDNWDELIRATLRMIEYWYKRYENKLMDQVDAPTV